MSSAAGAGEPSSSSRPVRVNDAAPTYRLCVVSYSTDASPNVSSSQGKEREEGTDVSNRKVEDEGDLGLELYGAEAGWVEARTSCPHLPAMPAASADELARVPAPDSQCSRFVSSSSSSLVSHDPGPDMRIVRVLICGLMRSPWARFFSPYYY